MTNRDLALAYLRAFCAADIDALRPLLAADLRFSGPLHRFASSAEYLEVLAADPPQACGYEILDMAETDDSVAVFWEYRKPGKPVTIAQLFRIRGERISDILLVFDTGGYAPQPDALCELQEARR